MATSGHLGSSSPCLTRNVGTPSELNPGTYVNKLFRSSFSRRDTQHNDTQHSVRKMTVSITTLSVAKLYAECCIL